MDKVIIDGVDVSECEHYRAEIETKMPYGEYEIQKDKCHYSGIEIIQDCKGNKGCIYKQLKRLEQENERLKKEVETWNYQADKRAELSNIWFNTAETYKQALQEIRELIKKLDLSLGCAYGDYDCDKCSDINEETVCKIKLQNIILAKINEVIGAE